MDYKKIYDSIVSNIRAEKYERLGKHYTGEMTIERHHVVPRSHGGSDSEDNLVPCTHKEHYILHRLLQKIYPDCKAMAMAVLFMSHGRITSRKGLRPIPASTYSRTRSLAIAKSMGKSSHNAKLARVRCATTGRFVASNVCLTEWARMNGINNTGLRKCANKQQKSALGYIAEWI